MVNSELLLDRFGDEAFLHELWLKARCEIPERLEDLRPFFQEPEHLFPEDLGARLHKLRGLISNFLTDSQALTSLIDCEDLLETKQHQGLLSTWTSFELTLAEEIERLEAWLLTRGHSC